MKQIAEYGSWKSTITSDKLVGGNCKAICELQVSGDSVFWIEQTFPLGQRVVFEHNSQKNNASILWTGETLNIKNSVHEYGGGSFIPNGEMGILVANNGGIYGIDKPLANPKPIIEYKEADIRHADFYVHTDFVYAVREIHKSENDAPENLLIRARISTREEEVVASGADFYAEPRISPDGKMLAWLEWNNPNMPWDQTTINVIKINEDGSLGTQVFRLYSPLGSSSGTNYHGIQWSMQNNQPKLYVISDATGWWNVHEVGFSESGVFTKNVYPVDKDIGQPLWQFADDRPYAINSSYVVLGFDNKLWRKNLSNEEALVELNTPDFTSFSLLTLTKNNVLFCVASGPKRSQSLLRIDLHSNESFIIRETRSSKEIEDFDISMPEKLTFQSDGVNVEGYFYPPYSADYEAPTNALPPVVLLGHGGPTAKSSDSLDLKKQYYTSRGFAVFDVNYRGSTGYGKEFRNMLYKNWGVADRNDMINGAKFLIKTGKVDPKKICITGSSAGGFLVLSALMHQDNVFSAAVSLYGITDLIALAQIMHKFEYYYNMTLIADYPEQIEVYTERSPINHIDKVTTPIAFIHGTKDPVVPMEQSKIFYEALVKKNITAALMLLEGEAHGFRKSESIQKSVDATYYFLCKVLGIEPSVSSEIQIVNLNASKL